MDDETRRAEDWNAADVTDAGPADAVDAPGWDAPRPVGFCQDCGRPLTPETIRPVGKAVFCEPCLETKLGTTPGSTAGPSTAQETTAGQGYGGAQPGYGTAAQPGYGTAAQPGYGTAAQPGHTTSQPGYAPAPPPIPRPSGEPNPFLAGLLGLIPGVGAMYNGQFAKGIAHLIIFVLLDVMAENVTGIFWIFVWGWVFYQSFEAYHTAKARLEGLPLPNALGLNEIGERVGFGKTWGPVGQPAAQPVGQTGAPPATPWTTTPGTAMPPVPPAAQTTPWVAPAAPWATPAPPWTPPPAAGRDWVGYVPPTAFAQANARWQPAAAAPPNPPVQASVPPGAIPPPYVPPVYAETFTGTPADYAAPVEPGRRFPVGAIWLIGLGALILTANLIPNWRISDRWWTPVLLAGLSLWLFTRRLHSGTRLACIIRWPAILIVLAVLSALHAAYVVVPFGMTCAVLLIAFGLLLLLERAFGTSHGYAAPTGYSAAPGYNAASGYSAASSNVPTPAYNTPTEAGRAAFTTAAPEPAEAASPSDEPKGGQ